MKEILAHIEVTDTFCGEANYSWVKRFELRDLGDKSDLAIVRRVKKLIGWSGLRCEVQHSGDAIDIRPRDATLACFVTFDEVDMVQASQVEH